MDSHSLAYADEIMTLTGGQGVDVVLNSLPREHIPKGISLLAPFGRFLELGKTDIYRNAHLDLYPFRKNLSYFAIDMDMRDRKDKFRPTFLKLINLFKEGAFRPLPFKAFPMEEAEKAFRYMAERKHIGKILLLPKAKKLPQELSKASPNKEEEKLFFNPTQIAERVQPKVIKLAELYPAKEYKTWYEKNEALARIYARRALQQLGWFPRVNDRTSVDALMVQLKVVPKYRKLLYRILEILSQDGIIKKLGAEWEVVCADPFAKDPEEEISQIIASFPQVDPIFALLRQAGPEIPAVLQGRCNPLALLFPGGSLEPIEAVYENSYYSRPYNQIIEEIFRVVMDQLPQDKMIRILEIGAGTGGTASFVLPTLDPHQTEYLFTDVANFFLESARQKFKQYQFLKYKKLNIELDPASQGFPIHQFDFVIASNVLHVTASLRQTLENVRKLLAPGGLLILQEMALDPPPQGIDLTFGLFDGWWKFSDTELRKNHPLLTFPKWQKVLKEVGFTDIVRIPKPEIWGYEPALTNILARGPQQMGEEKQIGKIGLSSKASALTAGARAPLISPGEIAEKAQPEVAKIAASYGAKAYEIWYNRIEALSRIFARETLQKLGWSMNLGEKFSSENLRERLGIVPKYSRLLDRILEMVQRDGIIKKFGKDWEVVSVDLMNRNPNEEISGIIKACPQDEPSLELLRRCGQELPLVLRGLLNPIKLFFPAGSMDLVEAIFEKSIFAKPFNLISRMVVQAVMENIPQDQTIRILEIGAGTGGIAAALLPILVSRQVEYFFTDLSKVFLENARQKFQQFPFVRYNLLNIELPPQSQGYEPHQFNLIIAMDVLHATSSLRRTVENIREFLTPGGLLIIQELTKTDPQEWIELTFGLLDGWWKFSDFDVRKNHPLLTVQQWCSLLEKSGFTSCVGIPNPNEWGGEPEQTVILAKSSSLHQLDQPIAKKPPNTGFQGSSSINRYELRTVPHKGHSQVALAPGREIIIVNDGRGVAEALGAGLQSRGFPSRIVSNDTEIRPEMPVGAVIYLGGLRPLQNFHAGVKINKEAFRVAKAVVDRVPEAVRQGGGWFITVQDTGGDFGLNSVDTVSALRGGLAGLAKSMGVEWPGVYYKAIDIQTNDRSSTEIAKMLLEEILAGGDAPEVGLNDAGGRTTFQLVEVREPIMGGQFIDENSVIVVSGGARGVTAASIIELAKQVRPKFALFGRSPIIEEPEELRRITDSAGLKKAIFLRAERDGNKISPVELEKQAREILHSREVKATLEALKKAGSPVKYYAVDIMESRLMRTEGPAWIWKAGSLVKAALAEVRQEWGSITGLVHGAGLIMDRLIQDKTQQQFDIVFDTKVRGLNELLSALEKDPLKFICLFSSMSGRFGNTGQCDYAMANEVLNKIAQAEHQRRGAKCLVKSINWGVWDGGATPELIRKIGKQHGVSLLSFEEGSRAFVNELQTSDSSVVEVLLGNSKSIKIGQVLLKKVLRGDSIGPA